MALRREDSFALLRRKQCCRSSLQRIPRTARLSRRCRRRPMMGLVRTIGRPKVTFTVQNRSTSRRCGLDRDTSPRHRHSPWGPTKTHRLESDLLHQFPVAERLPPQARSASILVTKKPLFPGMRVQGTHRSVAPRSRSAFESPKRVESFRRSVTRSIDRGRFESKCAVSHEPHPVRAALGSPRQGADTASSRIPSRDTELPRFRYDRENQVLPHATRPCSKSPS